MRTPSWNRTYVSGVQQAMIRIRWSDSQSESPTSAVYWGWHSLVLGTLFFNFAFWAEWARSFPFSGPPLHYFYLLAGGTSLTFCLFYLGPALAVQASHRSLFDLAALSLGSLPALAFRLCCVMFLATWITQFVGLIVFAVSEWPFFRRASSPVEPALLSAAFLAFLFATGLQKMRTTAKLALFTDKLAVAILIAALIRVRGGLPPLWNAFSHATVGHLQSEYDAWLGLGVYSPTEHR
jgi:hypothetical protein